MTRIYKSLKSTTYSSRVTLFLKQKRLLISEEASELASFFLILNQKFKNHLNVFVNVVLCLLFFYRKGRDSNPR